MKNLLLICLLSASAFTSLSQTYDLGTTSNSELITGGVEGLNQGFAHAKIKEKWPWNTTSRMDESTALHFKATAERETHLQAQSTLVTQIDTKEEEENEGTRSLIAEAVFNDRVFKSINFEDRLFSIGLFKANFRLGLGKIGQVPTNNNAIVIGLSGLVGKNGHNLEVNGSYFLEFQGGDNEIISVPAVLTIPIISVGYRYQKPSEGVIITAKIGTLGAGIGLGYAF